MLILVLVNMKREIKNITGIKTIVVYILIGEYKRNWFYDYVYSVFLDKSKSPSDLLYLLI